LGAAYERTRGTRGDVVAWAMLVAGVMCRRIVGRARRDAAEDWEWSAASAMVRG
jgi:hypothetical protein